MDPGSDNPQRTRETGARSFVHAIATEARQLCAKIAPTAARVGIERYGHPGMARPLRVLFAGAVYHVMARGNERRPIYRDAADRLAFLDQLAVGVERYGLVCHSYCLMGNHYHEWIRGRVLNRAFVSAL